MPKSTIRSAIHSRSCTRARAYQFAAFEPDDPRRQAVPVSKRRNLPRTRNNLDLAIARYNLPIADTDCSALRAEGSFRGVNTGVVQERLAEGLAVSVRAHQVRALVAHEWCGGAGAGASGLVQSTLGAGTPVSSYDPALM